MRMSKCKGCEEVTSLLIGMRNTIYLRIFGHVLRPNTPISSELAIPRVRISLEIHDSNELWGLPVGVENSYDEVNVQIPTEYKYVFPQQIMLGQENVATPATDRSEYDDQNTDEPSSVITQLPHMHAVRSLRSDRALPKRRYDIIPCILVYPSMLSPEDRSEPISCFPPF
ncbi:hypothetical protein DY000_02030068 [Brassica cretica]|uniref:Uncharacterized protein n=1 Tax=Brassica cretica TaxID=69181 RepID=A0ABQ7DGT1_BRACR|nr:hypothetical protein DY000_02030068 [Brassica cretica]